MGVASRKTYWILFTFARPSISLRLRPTGIKLLLWMNINVEDLQTELWTVFLTQWQTRKLHSLDLLSRKTQGTRGIIMDRLTIVVWSCFWSVLSSDWLKNYVTSLAQWSENFVLFRQPIRSIYLAFKRFPALYAGVACFRGIEFGLVLFNRLPCCDWPNQPKSSGCFNFLLWYGCSDWLK